jgi:molybdopterin adenylyltransferase
MVFTEIKEGDKMILKPDEVKIGIITLSDRASEGIYEDKSGPRTEALVHAYFLQLGWSIHFERMVIPDNGDILKGVTLKMIAENTDIIFTTGGTGIGTRDITPDIIKPMLAKEITGVMEYIRVKYGAEKPAALLSRGVAGVIGKTLIYTLPGSVKAVEEYCDVILPTISHSLLMLNDINAH